MDGSKTRARHGRRSRAPSRPRPSRASRASSTNSATAPPSGSPASNRRARSHRVSRFSNNSPRTSPTPYHSASLHREIRRLRMGHRESHRTRRHPHRPARRRAQRKRLCSSPPQKRSERWKKILLEARSNLAALTSRSLIRLPKPEAAFDSSDGRRSRPSLRIAGRDFAPQSSFRRRQPTAALAIGPEGGWTDDEFAAARAAGFQEASLGKLILRTETAVVASLAALNFALSAD